MVGNGAPILEAFVNNGELVEEGGLITLHSILLIVSAVVSDGLRSRYSHLYRSLRF